MVLAVALDLEPFPAPRPRARAFQVAPGKWTASIYTPRDGEYRAWQEAAVLLLRAALRRAALPTFDGPVGLKVVFRFPLPKGEHRIRTLTPRRWHTAKPDLDNVLKSLQDAAKEAGWYGDDSQVCEVIAQKVCGSQVERPAVHVTLYPVEALA